MLNLANTPIIYITRDIERAIGLDLSTPGYFIISNYKDFANSAYNNNDNVLLIKDDYILDTHELLENSKAVEFIEKLETKNCKLLVFKNTLQIERICKKHNWKLLNPSAELANRVENKVSQVEWLGELKKYLPPTEVKDCKDVEFEDNPFILQFNRAHTGLGTYLITTLEQLKELQQKFSDRPVRVTEYITGPTLTSNNIVSKDKILVGNINYQITGLHPFTDNPFATVGNDWKLPHRLLSEEQKDDFGKMATDIGNKLRHDGWKGLFGIDVVMDEKSGKLYLIEINARQPASTSYESELQNQSSDLPIFQSSVTTFQAHLLSLLELNLNKSKIIPISTGAQVVQRVTKAIPSLPEPKLYKQENFKYIKYNNTKPEAD
ncbi:ATP-grasp domain-containing protein, partial [Patescibacteria group bacterium]|nr:ATP-grasp domain-containing protein [Patescibacteria group bacterium]